MEMLEAWRRDKVSVDDNSNNNNNNYNNNDDDNNNVYTGLPLQHTGCCYQ